MNAAKKSIATTKTMMAGANHQRSVAVIGGGIAGLAAALCFARRGAHVRVFEQAQEIKEVGAGLQITPNGGVVLAALGLGAEADEMSLKATGIEPMDALSGQRIAHFDLSNLHGQPYRLFHRADLLDILARACVESGVTITTNARADEIGDTHVRFSGGETVHADLIIGADGLHSRVRPELNGADAPFYTGQVAWRSVIRMPHAEPVARIWMAPGRHIVTYPLIGGRMNIVAVQERDDWSDEGWHYFDEPQSVLNVFADCAPEVMDILTQVQTVRRWGLFRHPVAKHWHDGRRVILGDAAHPTLPFLAQGANLAIEDAWVLAATCDAIEDLDLALAKYQSSRRPRVERAIGVANENARNYHLSGIKRRIAHAGLRGIGAATPGLFLKRLDWLYDHDVTKG